jgi:hypothetical protein
MSADSVDRNASRLIANPKRRQDRRTPNTIAEQIEEGLGAEMR